MNEREVSIYGQVYRVKGDDPDRIARVAGFVDQIMSQVLGGPGQGLSTSGAMLTALNIADEWFKHKEEMEGIVWNLNGRIEELLTLLPE